MWGRPAPSAPGTGAFDYILTTSFVSTLERGAKVPSLTTVLKIARALKLDASALLMDFSYDVLRKLKL